MLCDAQVDNTEELYQHILQHHGGRDGDGSMLMPDMKCVSCNKVANMASHVSDPLAKPDPGDVMICLYCGHVMVFDNDLRPRQPTDKEMYDIAGDPEIVAMQNARARIKFDD